MKEIEGNLWRCWAVSEKTGSHLQSGTRWQNLHRSATSVSPHGRGEALQELAGTPAVTNGAAFLCRSRVPTAAARSGSGFRIEAVQQTSFPQSTVQTCLYKCPKNCGHKAQGTALHFVNQYSADVFIAGKQQGMRRQKVGNSVFHSKAGIY